MPDETDQSSDQERRRLVDYRLKTIDDRLVKLEAQLAAAQLGLNTSLQALSGQINSLTDSLPDKFYTRREADNVIAGGIRQRHDNEEIHRELRLSIEKIRTENDNHTWVMIGSLIMAIFSLIGTAFALVAHH